MAEILGAALFASGILAFPALPQEKRNMALWQYLWQAVCRQPKVFLPILQETYGKLWYPSNLDQQKP